jgi:peptidoglycan/LPS O-acetylase OafA/YrhL
LPSLDGWRAISIALVLGIHCQRTAGFPPSLSPLFTRLFDGDLGVRFFFIISGFLITWLMISESDKTGRVSLRHFYARRALRILPIYLAFLCTVIILQLFTPYTQSIAAWIGNFTFTTNFIGSPWPTGHLWSLSVEEQFYFLWPGVFLLCHGPSKGIRPILKVLIFPLVFAPICRIITFKKFYPDSLAVLFAHFSFFNYFDSLGVGCLCAILLARRRQVIEACLQSRPKLMAVGGVALVLTPYLMQHLPIPGRITAATGDSLQAGGFAILLLQSILSPRMGFYRMLNWSWVRFIGVLSYSLYIWQQLFCAPPEMFGLKQVWWMSFPWWLVSVFIVASISYYGFERPLLKLRARFRDA